MQLHIIYTKDAMLLSKKSYSSWREVQDEYEDYKASLGPWDDEVVIEYLCEEYQNPRLEPPARAQVEDLVVGSAATRVVTFGAKYPCKCCGYLTLPEPSPGSLEICHVCCWQDDMVGFNRPDEVWGPNAVSLNEARENFRRCGASEEGFVAHVREPLPEELPPR